MTIERSFKPHWRAKTQTEEVQPGYSEIISTGFGVIKELTVESPDRIRVGTYIPRYKDTPVIGPLDRVFEKEVINQNSRLLSPTTTSTISLLIGERVRFNWKKSE